MNINKLQMNKNLAFLLISISLTFSSNILAEGFNDNYLQIGLIQDRPTHQTFNIKGSVDVEDNYSLIGAYSRKKGSSPSIFSIGVVKNFDLRAKNLGNLILKYTQFTTSLSAGNRNHSDVSIGLRAISNLDILLEAKYSRVGINGAKTNKYGLEASKDINKNLFFGGMIVLNKVIGEDDIKLGFFVRRSF